MYHALKKTCLARNLQLCYHGYVCGNVRLSRLQPDWVLTNQYCNHTSPLDHGQTGTSVSHDHLPSTSRLHDHQASTSAHSFPTDTSEGLSVDSEHSLTDYHPHRLSGERLIKQWLDQYTVHHTEVTDGKVVLEGLYKKLKSMSCEDVLSCFVDHHASMDKLHYAISLKRLFTIQSCLRGEDRREFLQNLQLDQRFQILCAVVTRKGRYYPASITFDIFRFLRSFGFDDSHPATQSYLQLLKQHLNDLHLDQLISLCHMTQQMVRSKNSDLIARGVAVLVPGRTHELTALSLFQLILLLDMFGSTLKLKWQKHVIHLVQRQLEDVSLSANSGRLLLRALSRVSVLKNPDLEELCIATIERNLKRYSKKDLNDIVTSLVSLGLYCPGLLTHIADRFAGQVDRTDGTPNTDHPSDCKTRITRFKDNLELLCNLSHQSHVAEGLLQAAAADAVAIRDVPVEDVVTFLNVAAFSGTSDTLRDLRTLTTDLKPITDLYLQHNHNNLEPVLSLCCSLLTLGVPLPSELCQLINSATDNITELAVETFTPEGQGGYSLPLSETLAVIMCHLPTSNSSRARFSGQKLDDEALKSVVTVPGLHTAVRLGLQDMSARWHHCHLDCGLCMDFLLENKPEDQRIAIKVLPPSAFHRNRGHMKGLPQLYVSALIKQGHKLLVVNPRAWKSIPERERHVVLKVKTSNILNDPTTDYLIV